MSEEKPEILVKVQFQEDSLLYVFGEGYCAAGLVLVDDEVYIQIGRYMWLGNGKEIGTVLPKDTEIENLTYLKFPSEEQTIKVLSAIFEKPEEYASGLLSGLKKEVQEKKDV